MDADLSEECKLIVTESAAMVAVEKRLRNESLFDSWTSEEQARHCSRGPYVSVSANAVSKPARVSF